MEKPEIIIEEIDINKNIIQEISTTYKENLIDLKNFIFKNFLIDQNESIRIFFINEENCLIEIKTNEDYQNIKENEFEFQFQKINNNEENLEEVLSKIPSIKTEYINETIDYIKCYICSQKIKIPMLCPECSKIACKECLIKNNSNCGICHKKTNFIELKNMKFVIEYIGQISKNHINFYCKNHENELYIYYCIDCNKSFCKKCFKDHAELDEEHRKIIFQDFLVFQEKTNFIKRNQEKINEFLKTNKSKTNLLTKAKKIYNEIIDKIKNDINKIISEKIIWIEKSNTKFMEFQEKIIILNKKITDYINNTKKGNLNYITDESLINIFNEKMEDINFDKDINEINTNLYTINNNKDEILLYSEVFTKIFRILYNNTKDIKILINQKKDNITGYMNYNKEFEGKVCIEYENQRFNKYIGEIKNGKRDGYGILYGNKKIEGKWKEDKIEKYGISTFQGTDGNIFNFVGKFNNNLNSDKIGFACPEKENGYIYFGQINDGQSQGYGMQFYSNDDKFVCNFSGNDKNGMGVHIDKNKNIEIGYFNNDKKVGEFNCISSDGKLSKKNYNLF